MTESPSNLEPPSNSMGTKKGPPPRCDCSILHRIESVQGNPGWNIIELVRVPSSTFGYLDPQTGKQETSVRRRYSDFEYLHEHFSRLYPFSVIPPIPEKHPFNMSFTNMIRQSSSKEMITVVEYRVRAFQSFIYHVLSHPILHADHSLHLFLSNPDSSWRTELMQYEPIELKAPKTLLAHGDKQLADISALLPDFIEQCKQLESSQRNCLRKMWDIRGTMDSLGTQFNSFSLEYAPLCDELERVGDDYDGLATSYSDAVITQQHICENIHEMGTFLEAIQVALKNFQIKNTDLELIRERANKARSEILSTVDSDLAEIELEEKNLSDELYNIKESLTKQVIGWMGRLSAEWHKLLVRISSAHYTFSTQLQSSLKYK